MAFSCAQTASASSESSKGSGGATQKYTFDSADRLYREGVTYDDFGRIKNLPGVYAGGKALTTTYFANDMIATQSQNGVTNTFQLDATLRQRQHLQENGLAGVEVFHYAGPSDSPSWTQRGSTWTRSIAGVGGELAAIQESGKEIDLQLTNLHGDVSAKAALSPSVTELKSTLRFDEFGNPTGGSAGRFGWLGGKQRRTELSSGVIQMGVRSYVPSLGRFLTPDPVFGGSDNLYDYAKQDPINLFDLTGECAHPGHGKCYGPPTPAWARRRASRLADRNNIRHAVVTSRKCTANACRVGWPHGGGGADRVSKFISGVANDVIDHLLNDPNITGMSLRENIETTYGAVSTPLGRKAVACASAATAGWAETAATRGSFPVGGLASSLLYVGTRCVVGALVG